MIDRAKGMQKQCATFVRVGSAGQCGPTRAHKPKNGRRKNRRPQIQSLIVSLIVVITAPATSLDIAITIAVITKQRDFPISMAAAIKGLRDHIAIADIAARIIVPPIIYEEPTERIIARVIMEEAMKRAVIAMAVARPKAMPEMPPMITRRMAIRS